MAAMEGYDVRDMSGQLGYQINGLFPHGKKGKSRLAWKTWAGSPIIYKDSTQNSEHDIEI